MYYSNSSSCHCNLQNLYRAWNGLPLSILVAPGLFLAVRCRAIVASGMQIFRLESTFPKAVMNEKKEQHKTGIMKEKS